MLHQKKREQEVSSKKFIAIRRVTEDDRIGVIKKQPNVRL